MIKKLRKCEFCNIKFKNISQHLRFCKAKAATQQEPVNEMAIPNYQNMYTGMWQENNALKKELNALQESRRRQIQVINGYRETLGAAGRLLAALVDVPEIN